MDAHKLEVPTITRYFSHGELSSRTNNIWIVCHGYGQLAEYFIKKFEILDPIKNFVLAPEGMNRFYLEGFSGRVGATWMTKEDRECDIKNYIRQLDSLYRSIAVDMIETTKIHLLGFSQGTATISRWLMNSEIEFNDLVMWAGKLAHEIDLNDLAKRLDGKRMTLVLGNKDEFYSMEMLEEYKSVLKNNDVDLKVVPFEGAHALDTDTILSLENGFK